MPLRKPKKTVSSVFSKLHTSNISDVKVDITDLGISKDNVMREQREALYAISLIRKRLEDVCN